MNASDRNRARGYISLDQARSAALRYLASYGAIGIPFTLTRVEADYDRDDVVSDFNRNRILAHVQSMSHVRNDL